MVPLAPNPETGFLESGGVGAFDSAKKVKFLEIARHAAENKLMPDVPGICKALNVSTFVFYEHRRLDELFRAQWETVLDTCESTLVQMMYANGQRPSGYMDRITWLRAHRPGMWNPDLKVNINQDSSQVKGLFEGAKTIIEADIVPNQVSIATGLQQTSGLPSEK